MFRGLVLQPGPDLGPFPLPLGPCAGNFARSFDFRDDARDDGLQLLRLRLQVAGSPSIGLLRVDPEAGKPARLVVIGRCVGVLVELLAELLLVGQDVRNPLHQFPHTHQHRAVARIQRHERLACVDTVGVGPFARLHVPLDPEARLLVREHQRVRGQDCIYAAPFVLRQRCRMLPQ